MAVTRIKNNQITDSTINAAAKVQGYTITGGLLANNLTYGSDFTVSGNLTVQGNTTTIDTNITTIEDPVIVLASTQTGSPTVDIGFIGQRGTSNNVAFVWQESSDEFITAFTSTSETNTVIAVSSYANFKTLDANITGNLVVAGTSGFTGNITAGNILIGTSKTIDMGNNIIGNVADPLANTDAATKAYVDSQVSSGVSFDITDGVTTETISNGDTITFAGVANETTVTVSATDTITVGLPSNVVVQGSLSANSVNSSTTVSATGNITGGNVDTGGQINATGNIAGGNLTTAGQVSATANITGGNVNTGGEVSATANVTGGNLVTGGVITATGNITGGNVTTAGQVSATGDVTSAANVVGGNINTAGLVTATGNVTGGNINTGGQVSATANVTGGNLVTSGLATVTGNITGGNISTAGLVTATGNVTGGNLTTAGEMSALGNVIGGNVTTIGLVSATGNVTGGNLVTAGLVTATGNVDGGNINTAGQVSATANITGGNILTAGLMSATGTITSAANVIGGNLTTAGQVSATGDVTGGNILTSGNVSATGNLIGGNVVTTTVTTSSGDLSLNSAGGDVTFNGAGNLIMNNRYINSLPTPLASQDAATKQYVDDAVSTGITIHTPVYLESPDSAGSLAATYAQGGTTATVTDTVAGNTVVFSSAINPQVNDQLWFTNSFSGIVANTAYFVVSAPNTSAAVLSASYNGQPVTNISNATGLTQAVRINSGQGATLTANANGQLSIDGVNPTVSQRVLIYNQTNAYENGVYDVTQTGNVSAPYILTRSSDMDTYIPDNINGMDAGDYFFVQAGNSGAGESYVMTAPIGPFIIGYDSVTFTQFSASQVYSANTAAGIVLNGTTFSAKVDNDTTAFDGGGNISVKAGANLVTPNIGNATGNSLTLSGNGVLQATTVSATGNVIGGNITTAGQISATGNIDSAANIYGANITTGGIVSATANITGGNLLTGGLVSATGNLDAGNVNTGGVVTATGNITGGNLITSGLATVTGNITGGNITTAGNVSANYYFGNGSQLTGVAAASVDANNLTGNTLSANVINSSLTSVGNLTSLSVVGTTTTGNLDTGGTVSATGNVTGGNVNTAGLVTATGNVIGGNILTTGEVSATGNVTGNYFIGNGALLTGIDATQIQFGTSNVKVVTANGNVTTSINGTSNVIVVSQGGGDVTGYWSATGNVTGGNLYTAGETSATGNVTGGNLVTAGLATVTGNVIGGNITTAGLVTATGNVDGGNINTAGIVSATGDVYGNNITLNNGNIDGAASGTITINGSSADTNFAVNGDTAANVFFVDAGTGTASFGSSTQTTNAIVAFNATNSILFPVGNTAQRPSVPVEGMVRYNTTIQDIEVYDADEWKAVGTPVFTVIVDDQFNGDGSTVAFTLSQSSTTAGVVVSINGVVQIPTTAYSVSGTTLTFTEAPLTGDVIDVRIFTTTTTVTGIENAPGNASITTSPTSDTITIEGNLVPSANVTYNLGSSSMWWKDGYFAGNTIYLGGLQMKASGNTFVVYTADGVTQANIDAGSIDVSAISSGTSSIGLAAPNGNAYITVGGSADRLIVSTAGANIQGTLGVTGNITGNYILGNGSLLTGIDATSIQSGTSNVKVVSSGGDVTVGVGGTSNVAVFSTSGVNVTGNVTAGGITLSGNTISSTGTTLTIDPSAAGATGLVVIAGNLQVQGTTTTIDSTTVTINDLVFTTANNAATASAANGGGLEVGPAGSSYATWTYDQPNSRWTTALGINATGNIVGGNIVTGGAISATGNITGGNIVTGGGSGGNITGANVISATTLSVANILNSGANGVGNIGNATTYFNTVFAKATSAQYADLAEMYEADGVIEPGTVVAFGGTQEVTACGEDGSRRVAGVVSTNPSYIMNAGLAGEHVVAVALTGRVPTKVTGTVRKGDLMVAAGGGRARAEANPQVGAVIGKALADFDGAEGTIEVVIGRF